MTIARLLSESFIGALISQMYTWALLGLGMKGKLEELLRIFCLIYMYIYTRRRHRNSCPWRINESIKKHTITVTYRRRRVSKMIHGYNLTCLMIIACHAAIAAQDAFIAHILSLAHAYRTINNPRYQNFKGVIWPWQAFSLDENDPDLQVEGRRQWYESWLKLKDMKGATWSDEEGLISSYRLISVRVLFIKVHVVSHISVLWVVLLVLIRAEAITWIYEEHW